MNSGSMKCKEPTRDSSSRRVTPRTKYVVMDWRSLQACSGRTQTRPRSRSKNTPRVGALVSGGWCLSMDSRRPSFVRVSRSKTTTNWASDCERAMIWKSSR